VAKNSMDNGNNPPRVGWKPLLPLCKKNSINLCMCKGAMYHRTWYLQN